MKFNKGDRVYSKIFNKEGEVLYIDEFNIYLIGIKDCEGFSVGPFPKEVELEIEKKGYKGHCFRFLENELESVKGKNKIKNIDIIKNNRELNRKNVCEACCCLKHGCKNCSEGYYCDECGFNTVEACFDFLNSEHEALFKLTQFEYDLLTVYKNYGEIHNACALTAMKQKGYYKNIKDISKNINFILENCEVEEEK